MNIDNQEWSHYCLITGCVDCSKRIDIETNIMNEIGKYKELFQNVLNNRANIISTTKISLELKKLLGEYTPYNKKEVELYISKIGNENLSLLQSISYYKNDLNELRKYLDSNISINEWTNENIDNLFNIFNIDK